MGQLYTTLIPLNNYNYILLLTDTLKAFEDFKNKQQKCIK